MKNKLLRAQTTFGKGTSENVRFQRDRFVSVPVRRYRHREYLWEKNKIKTYLMVFKRNTDGSGVLFNAGSTFLLVYTVKWRAQKFSEG